MDNQTLIKLRTKKLAILMLNARQVSKRSQEECADFLGIPLEQYQAYENGLQAPSLPELESFAFFLDIPLNHFWGKEALAVNKEDEAKSTFKSLRQLRNRIINARIGLEKTQADLSNEGLAEKTGIASDTLNKYEKDNQPIPLPQLEILAQTLGIPIEIFFDQKGPAGQKRTDQEQLKALKEMPEELQRFICQPVNRPYIELAHRLQGLSVEKLRSIAEGLLEITY
jgi:transcriptional regulator with XRE-family HTH domain